MNNPYVEALYYRFLSESPQDLFDGAVPLSAYTVDFELELSGGTLIAKPFVHFADVDTAKASLESTLHSWESVALLQPKRHRIRFTFERANVIDLSPTSDVVEIGPLRLTGTVSISANVIIVRNNGTYPPPDPAFLAGPVTDAMITRFKLYLDRRDLLPNTAYWILSKIEEQYGGTSGQKRKSAANQLGVNYKVLDKLGELVARADPTIGRKAKGNQTPLTQSELNWIEAVAARLIRRVGEADADAGALQIVELRDFPLV